MPCCTPFYPSSIQFCQKDFPDAGTDSSECNNAHITGRASQYALYLSVAQTGVAVLVSITLGSLSDRIGRKIPLVMGAASVLAEGFALLLVEAFNLPLFYIIIGEAISGLLGGPPLFLMSLFAMAIDSMEYEKRTLKIGILEGVLYSGELRQWL